MLHYITRRCQRYPTEWWNSFSPLNWKKPRA